VIQSLPRARLEKRRDWLFVSLGNALEGKQVTVHSLAGGRFLDETRMFLRGLSE
jgi:hypothetical protein